MEHLHTHFIWVMFAVGQRASVLSSHPFTALPPVAFIFGLKTLCTSFPNKVEGFNKAEEDANTGSDDHEKGEDVLLCGPGYEAVYNIGTRFEGAFHHTGECVVWVHVVEDEEEYNVHSRLEDEAEEIGPPQASTLLARRIAQCIVYSNLLPIFLQFGFSVGNMHDYQQGRTGNQNKL